MSENIGCGDNSCIFSRIRPKGGVGTNGGCRCFKQFRHWDSVEGVWNDEAIRRVREDTQRLAGELRRTREALKVARDALRVATTHRPEDRELVVAALRAVLTVLP